MSNSLVVQQASKLAGIFNIPESEDLVNVLKATAFKGQVSDAQMTALLIVANQYTLNPWTKEIYAFPDKNNGIVPVVGVDGWSRIINSHPQFDGMDFEQDNESCTCIMYRKDRTRPVRVTEYLSECKRPVAPWQSHPKRMLRHKAMIQCARLAFGFVGIYDQDEAERIVDVTPAPTRQSAATTAEQTISTELTADDTTLLAELETIAAKGTAALEEKWFAITKEQRKALAGHLNALKALASAANVTDVEVSDA
ncbi:phage recombination protein Bet [[Empedobacter] haloabium]|uniref:Phage recombination protein Bet n=1 Tax=[Empedobacter] haloabium TaxID=592317 RepID=A0ABZ1UUS2_9BURK